VFASVDSVIQTGQDPRRFVEDLLERLRDLIVVLAVGEKADSVLRGVPKDQIEKLTTQAFGFGMASLTHASEVVSETLNSMSGATSPKLQLELMCAKVLVPAAGDTEAGSLARLDRLERRVGMCSASNRTRCHRPTQHRRLQGRLGRDSRQGKQSVEVCMDVGLRTSGCRL
jgi:DNA polymerase-3 subunit gamma/tau